MPATHVCPMPAMREGDFVTNAVVVGRDYLPGRVLSSKGGWYQIEYPFDGSYRVATGFVPARKVARGI